MIIKLFFLTNFGNVRTSNEDAILLHDSLIINRNMRKPESRIIENSSIVLCVADGMGGHVKGEMASATVLETVQNSLPEMLTHKSVKKVILESRKKLNRVAISENAYGLGTTLTGLAFHKKKALLFNCGDSRIYRAGSNFLEKLTNDHSLVQGLYDSGLIDEEGMRNHPNKNILTSAIIGDLSDEEPKITIRSIDIKIGSMFLLCTDGLWESLNTDELIQCFDPSLKPEEISEKLLKESIEKGGRDNISYILAQIIDI